MLPQSSTAGNGVPERLRGGSCAYRIMERMVEVRRGTEADARAAADLWLRAREASLDAIPRPVHSDDDVRAWFAFHVVRETELWVAEEPAGALLGILVLDGSWVDQLYAEPAATGRGIGAQLLQLAKGERPAGLRLAEARRMSTARRCQRAHPRGVNFTSM